MQGAPSVTILMNPTDGIMGGSVTSVTLTASGVGHGTSLSYQWKDASGAIGGATSTMYTATAAGTYTCEVTDNLGLKASASATVMCRVRRR